MPRSRSWSIESMTRSVTSSWAEKTPDWRSIASTSVVLPWSTCAMIATLRMSVRAAAMLRPPSVRTAGASGLQHDLDGAVLLLLEGLVGVGGVVERQVVGGEALHAQRVIVGEQRHDLRHPALDVRLAHAQLDLLVEERQHRQRVRLAAIDAAERDRPAAAHDVDRGVERRQPVDARSLHHLLRQ